MDLISKVVIVVLMVIVRIIVCGGIIASASLAVFSLVAYMAINFSQLIEKTMVDPSGLIMFISITAVVAVVATIAAWSWTPKTAS